jgi:hypothetical protein
VQGETGLAGPARAGERHEPLAVEQQLDRGQLLAPAHEAGELDRQVVGQCVQRAQRGQVAWQVGVAQLVDALGAGQVAEAVGPQVVQLGSGRQGVGHHGRRGRRQKRLPAVGDVAQAGAPVEGRTGVIPVVAYVGLTGVQPDANRRPAAGPCLRGRLGTRLRGHGPLDGQGGGDRLACRREGGDAPSAPALHHGLDTPVIGDGRGDDLVEPGERLVAAAGGGLAERQALDLGQQERHRSRRQDRCPFL